MGYYYHHGPAAQKAKIDDVARSLPVGATFSDIQEASRRVGLDPRRVEAQYIAFQPKTDKEKDLGGADIDVEYYSTKGKFTWRKKGTAPPLDAVKISEKEFKERSLKPETIKKVVKQTPIEATAKELKQIKAEESLKRLQQLLAKQRGKAEITEEGIVTPAFKPGRKTVITPSKQVVDVPTTAKVSPGQVSAFVVQKQKALVSKPKPISKFEAAKKLYTEDVMPIYGGVLAVQISRNDTNIKQSELVKSTLLTERYITPLDYTKSIIRRVRRMEPIMPSEITKYILPPLNKISGKFSDFSTMKAIDTPLEKALLGKNTLTTAIVKKISPEFEKRTREEIQAAKISLQKALVGFPIGIYKEVREKPMKLMANTALYTVITGGLGLAGAGLTKAGIKIFKPIEKTLVYGLPLLWGGIKLKEISEMPKDKRPEKTGRIFIGEIMPMAAGGYLGIGIGRKALGKIRTFGLQEVMAEKIIDPRVLAGKQQFPTAPPKAQYKLFVKSRHQPPTDIKDKVKVGVWHAAPTPFKTKVSVEPGTSELPGLYTAPSLSAYFLKVRTQSPKLYGTELLPNISPTALFIKPTAIKRLPRKLRTDGKLWSQLTRKEKAELRKYYSEVAKKGEVIIPEVKTEIEGIIPPMSKLIFVNARYFVKFKGVDIPIIKLKAVGKTTNKMLKLSSNGKTTNKMLKLSSNGRTYKRLSESYKYEPALISPGSFGAGIAKSSRISISRISMKLITSSLLSKEYTSSNILRSYSNVISKLYTPPYRPPSRPPYTPPYRPPSRPPYTPPYRPPSRPPYTPPYRPPSRPPYTPPYRPPSRPPYTPPYRPPPIIWTPPMRGIPKITKTNRRKDRRLMYQPSLVPIQEKLIGKKPKFLTGLFIRPIVR